MEAVFQRADDRTAIEDVARLAGAPFRGIWLEADPSVLWDRVSRRAAGPSDADTSVLARQLEGPDADAGWLHIDASGSVEAVSAAILAAIGSR